MNFEEFNQRLAKYLPNESPANIASEPPKVEEMTAPFENFFDEPLFLLLYNCDHPLSVDLDTVRGMLRGISDASLAERDRAVLALSLAKAARTLCAANDTGSTSTEAKFLGLAMGWGSVQAHMELAALRLREAGLSLGDGSDGHPLPSVKVDQNSRKSKLFLIRLEIKSLWLAGADLALAAAEAKFPGWTLPELHAAFSCGTHFCAISDKPLEPRILDANEARKLRQWLVPLLKLLYERIHEIVEHDRLLLKTLRRQTHAVQAMLAAAVHDEQHPSNTDCDSESDDAGATVVVIRGNIPKATDRSDNDLLTQYEVLRKPMALAPVPSREQIAAIQSKLEQEFPWATAAIEVIMAEIRARKRFGSRVLGMQPVLLCGPPGTGKTRLTQRLAELLAIPNTVINMSGMTDVKTLKGVTRGWASNRPSRIVEAILHHGPSHLFLLDEVDKAHGHGTHAGEPQEALLDLVEPQNAHRYGDVFLQTECDVSHCLYILTANSVRRITEPLLSRLCLAYVPEPGPEHAKVIADGLLRDIEQSWQIPAGTLEISSMELQELTGLSPREMRRALMMRLGAEQLDQRFTLH